MTGGGAAGAVAGGAGAGAVGIAGGWTDTAGGGTADFPSRYEASMYLKGGSPRPLRARFSSAIHLSRRGSISTVAGCTSWNSTIERARFRFVSSFFITSKMRSAFCSFQSCGSMSQPMGVIFSCRSVADSEAQCEPNGVRNSGGGLPGLSEIVRALWRVWG